MKARGFADSQSIRCADVDVHRPSCPSSHCVQDPLKVGVVLSGGQALCVFPWQPMKSETLCTVRICQAPGGHNVIAGIYDGIKAWNKDIRRLSIRRPIPSPSHSPAVCIRLTRFFWAYCKFKNKMCGSFFELWSNIHKLYHLISLLISRICLVFHHQLQIPYWSGCRNGQIFAMLLWGLQHVWIPGWTSRSVLWQLRGDYRCDHGWIPQYWCSPWWWVSFAYLLLLLLKHQKWSL